MLSTKPLIYVAGPLTTVKAHSTFGNIHHAVMPGDALANMGFGVFIPHLNAVWEMICPDHDYEFWIDQDMQILARCDALFRCSGESGGTDREVAFMREKKKPVLYTLDEAATFLEKWKKEHVVS